MSRDKRYQRLLNARRWKALRMWKLQCNPLCERCMMEGEAAGISGGYIRSAVDVHHIIPVESARTVVEMERLAYDPANLQSLCISCHVKTHKEMGKNLHRNVMKRKQTALQRWIELHRPPEDD